MKVTRFGTLFQDQSGRLHWGNFEFHCAGPVPEDAEAQNLAMLQAIVEYLQESTVLKAQSLVAQNADAKRIVEDALKRIGGS